MEGVEFLDYGLEEGGFYGRGIYFNFSIGIKVGVACYRSRLWGLCVGRVGGEFFIFSYMFLF